MHRGKITNLFPCPSTNCNVSPCQATCVVSVKMVSEQQKNYTYYYSTAISIFQQIILLNWKKSTK